MAREERLHSINRFQKTLPLLLGTSYLRHDRPANKGDDEQDRHSRATRLVGHRACPFRHRVSALGCN